MALLLREGRPEDHEAIVATFTDSVHELARPYYDETQRAAWAPPKADLEQWRTRLASMKVLVAEDDGRLAGFIGYQMNGYVALLFTASRDARRGVASMLYARVEHEWRGAATARAFAEVSLAARPFFERQGFRVVEEEHVERGGATFLRFKMAKDLLPST